MVTSDSFRAEVERFLERTGLSASSFGREAVGDPNFVSDLRDGRAPTLRVADKVQAFMKQKLRSVPKSDAAA